MYKFCANCKKMVTLYRTTTIKNFLAIGDKVKEEWIQTSCRRCGFTVEVVVVPVLSIT